MKSLLITVLLTSSGITLFLSVYAFIKIRTEGSVAYMALMLAVSFYAGGYAFELSNETLEGIMWALRIEYIGIATLPVFWVIMALQYAGYGYRLTRMMCIMLFIIPLITILLLYTNAYHHLYYKRLEIDFSGPFPLAAITKGIWYYINLLYANFIIIAGNILFFRMIFKSPAPMKRQALVMFVTSLVPWIGNFIYQMGLIPYGIDIIPFFLTCTGPFFALSLFRYRMFDLTPIARDFVFMRMKDPVIVLDNLNRIIDFNDSARKLLINLGTNAIGGHFNQIFSNRHDLLRQVETEMPENIEVRIHSGNTVQYFNSQVTHINSSKRQTTAKILMLHDITGHKKILNKLHTLATIDELTGIYNRRHFIQISRKEFLRAQRTKRSVSILIIDIDFFKKVNDTYGHFAGDRVLKAVAQLLQDNLRSRDILGRYGGEEFTVFLPDTRSRQALEIADRLRKSVKVNRIHMDTFDICVTVSIGVSGLNDVTDGNKMEDLLLSADKALYQAKENGRDRVEISTGVH